MSTKKNEVLGSEIQLVVFRLGGEEFGLDISQVREIIRLQEITPMPKAPDFIEGVINLRGQIIAVMDLAKRLGFTRKDSSDKARIVVIDVKESLLGLVVDEVPEVLRILESNVEPTPEMIESQAHAEFIKGVGKFGKRLIILLDAQKIVTREEASKLSTVAAKS